jgi:zinc transport system ATP-binding protein
LSHSAPPHLQAPTMGSLAPAVLLEGVSFSYGPSTILDSIDLSVAPGEFLAVLGPNGGGKTTMIKLILGLLKPGAGRVSVFGKDPGAILSKVGYVPQQSLIRPEFPVTVLDIVLTGLATRGELGWRFSSDQTRTAMEVLDRVGMLGLERKRYGDLSGGQKQRVLIARALVSGPKLLLLDEPTSNIDPQGKFCFYHFLEGLKDSITILAVSHDMGILASRLTSVACINRGLLYNSHPELTPEMITLLYGAHDERSCPAGDFFKDKYALLAGGVRVK